MIDEGLLQFATDRQAKIVKALNEGRTRTQVADEMGVRKNTVDSALRDLRNRAARRGYAPDCDFKKFAPETHIVKGTSTLYGDDGSVKQQWVKTDIRKDRLVEDLRIVAEEIAAEVRGVIPPVPRPVVEVNEDLAFSVKLGDAHLGLYAWGEETGDEDYDVKKASADLLGGVDLLYESAPPAHTCIVTNVGDFFHANDKKGVTPLSENRLDVDSRHGKVIRRGVFILKHVINGALHRFQRVVVMNARGNHDPDSAQWLTVVLEEAFANEPRVEIVRNDCKYQTYVWGDVFFATNHGEKKPQDQYNFISSRYREQFGRAKYVYIDNGHVHHKSVIEIGSARFEVWNTLTASDAYHADNSYGASRSITSVTYHKRFGEVGRNVCDLRQIREAAK